MIVIVKYRAGISSGCIFKSNARMVDNNKETRWKMMSFMMSIDMFYVGKVIAMAVLPIAGLALASFIVRSVITDMTRNTEHPSNQKIKNQRRSKKLPVADIFDSSTEYTFGVVTGRVNAAGYITTEEDEI